MQIWEVPLEVASRTDEAKIKRKRIKTENYEVKSHTKTERFLQCTFSLMLVLVFCPYSLPSPSSKPELQAYFPCAWSRGMREAKRGGCSGVCRA